MGLSGAETIKNTLGEIAEGIFIDLAARRYIRLIKKFDDLSVRADLEKVLFNESAEQKIREKAVSAYGKAERVLESAADIGGPVTSARLYSEIISRVCEEQGIPQIRLDILI